MGSIWIVILAVAIFLIVTVLYWKIMSTYNINILGAKNNHHNYFHFYKLQEIVLYSYQLYLNDGPLNQLTKL